MSVLQSDSRLWFSDSRLQPNTPVRCSAPTSTVKHEPPRQQDNGSARLQCICWKFIPPKAISGTHCARGGRRNTCSTRLPLPGYTSRAMFLAELPLRRSTTIPTQHNTTKSSKNAAQHNTIQRSVQYHKTQHHALHNTPRHTPPHHTTQHNTTPRLCGSGRASKSQ